MKTQAYIYIWIHSLTGMWYLGSRTKIGCHPDDGYICSSNIVKPLIQQNKNEWSRYILDMGNSDDILHLEYKLLVALNAKHDPMSFNMHNGDGKFTTSGIKLPEEWKLKISNGNRGKKRSDAARENYKRANRKKAHDPEIIKKLKKPKPPGHGEKVSSATKGIPKSESHKKALSVARRGKKTGPCTDSRKLAISAALKGKHTLPLIVCPHCSLEGRANMQRWHFDNCKKKKL